MTFDLIVLGGGPAGYLASERAGHAGLSVCCIEERSVGGVCLNEGCIPTKTLLYSAKIFDGAAHGEKYGVTAEGLTIDHARVVARKDKVVKTLVAGVQSALKANGVVLVNARGVITGRNAEGYTVDAGGETYTGKRLLIATGSSPAVPPIPGLKEGLANGFVCTNREILQLTQKPEHLCVIGGGVIGLELASYFASIGSKVTVIEMLDHIAGENDPDLVAILKKSYEKRGVTFQLSAKVTEVTASAVKYEKDGAISEVACDKVLLSIGRRANTKDIGLESIHVLVERGAVVTDAQMKTNQPEVYAAGDVNGKSMLAHTAYREAEVAVNTMLGKHDTMRYEAIPGVLYTNPELSAVGETEASAKAKGLDAACVKLPMRFSGRYLAENEGGDGIMKLVVDNATRKVLGAQVLSNYSSEFIVTVGTFIELGLTVDEVKEIVFPHPTVCEIVREAVFQF
ncbi:Dihydrolipoyl dehydrogenase [bioreactor metagenome]|uniref:Dihydrolipoyl dehydrogenase n=1 Tax=bioreactor metagenome TaxID=1076179 RepID=A0A644X181_9ZZZZ